MDEIFIPLILFLPHVHVFLQCKGRFIGRNFCPAKFSSYIYNEYYYYFSSQCDNKAGEDSTPVHVLAHEGGAGTEISSQHPVPDSAVQTAPGEYNMFAFTITP